MEIRRFLWIFVLCFIAACLCFAASDPQLGTWKLNEEKSTTAPNMGKNTVVTFKGEGDKVKVTVDGVNADGTPRHNEWVGKYDGKDYSVTGDPTSDTRSYTVVDDHTVAMIVKKDGKETIRGTAAISADGKTRTLKISGVDSKGNQFELTAVYDKQ
jgi:hypothetical protein